MSQKNVKLLYPRVQNVAEQLVGLFNAQAIGTWIFEPENTAVLLAESHASTTPKTPSFRHQIANIEALNLPKQITYINGMDTQAIAPLILKSTMAKNMLIIPLRRSHHYIGLVAVLNLDEWHSTYHKLAAYIADQATEEWSLIQQLQQQQRQLNEMTDQSRQWQGIYTGVQESIVLLNLKGKILTLNPATEHITGYTAQEMIGRHIGELFPKVSPLGTGIDYPGRSGLYQTLEERRPSDLFEAIVETKDRRHIWINYTYTPLWDGNGQMMGLVRVTSDVSTIKTVEQMKNDFVSIASHELRTPLGVIMGYLNLFLAGQLGTLTRDQQTFMERIYHSSADMAALVEDLLNISRIEAGRLEVSVQPFNLDQLITEVLSHLELRSQAKSIRINVKLASHSMKLRADRQKIEQALTNIIDNAIKYTYDNGIININARIKDGVVEITVKDSGVGINPEHIGHIFEKFYRENNPLSVKEGGSGLGLYISRKLIELHGGTITATSKPGQGSTFTIQLPVATKKYPVNPGVL